MTRYEKGERNPKEERTREIANILDVSYNSIKYYDFSNKSDLFYLLMWIEELYPNFGFKMNLQSDELCYFYAKQKTFDSGAFSLQTASRSAEVVRNVVKHSALF